VLGLQREGFLAARATAPELVLDRSRPYFQVDVERGPQFMVESLEFDGAHFFTGNHLQAMINGGQRDDFEVRPPEFQEPIEPFPFTSDWLETARQRISNEYWRQGFNDVQVRSAANWDNDRPAVVARFEVTEGDRQIIERIEIDGVEVTDMGYVMRHFDFKEGDPVDYSRINLTRKRLYDARVFKRVDIDIVPGQTPNRYTAKVALNETAPWRIRYGFAVANRLETSDRELGIATDLTYGNLFGRGITLGFSVKGRKTERDGRVYASFPVFLGHDVTSTATAFRTRDLSLEGITQDLAGITLQQQWRLSSNYIFSYDYSFRRIHSFDPLADPNDPFGYDLTFDIGRFNTALSRDTRDDVLNASRGSFISNSFEFAPPGFGTHFKFIKNYAQFFYFKPIKANLVWASGVRVGMARGFDGQDLIPSEQFLAGGGTTLRAFRQDELTPDPGNATLILNQEIRAPLIWRFSGVAFFDAGNVYKDIRSLKLSDLRYSPGLGLRIDTGVVLVRFDVGFNVRAREGESPRRFVFGIGQAF
jgi:outer membrane protein assembly factor BamA